ncbi:adenine deaminase [Flammeovirga pectinis]|uniref:Adenine deaminase n=1 Tax=Flammeovirga pectinis TaxID=2494373 RepID=A0A3S9P1D9_9BACT|nr:adenine deaminase [Flammeovirga pectinis]AZQ62016.1 adenine deaminase [Flammeovirga pectinis]
MATEIKGNIVDVHKRMIYPGCITIEGKRIKSIKYDESSKGISQYIVPGFVDAHIHIESSMLAPVEFAKIAVRHGTVATISDPHEIANVVGIEGIHYMIENGKQTPFKFNFGAPSCVPATAFETAGDTISVSQIEELLANDDIKYLSEMMNWPGVLNNDADVMAKIRIAKTAKKPVDGHAPGLKGKKLIKYAAAGISTDHESFELDEALHKIEHGMKIQIREGSAAKNFEALSPLLKSHPSKLMFCTDDSHPHELINGHMDKFIKRALDMGTDIFDAIKIASIHPIEHYNLDVGQLREGDYADFVIINNMSNFKPIATYINGVKVAENGKELFSTPTAQIINKFNCQPKKASDFNLALDGKNKVRVIVAHDGQLITSEESHDINSLKENDVLKVAVVNRYQEAPVSVAYIKGFGLKEGAIASTVAHDSHNIVAVGVTDEAIAAAVNKVIDMQGGLCIKNDTKEATFALPIAGLMTNIDGESAAKKYIQLLETAKEFGSTLHDPYMTLSFMALLVIPQLKISDKGLFDGKTFNFVNLFVD